MFSTTRKALIFLVLVAALLRLPALRVLPEVSADEGLWTSSTKNFLLFGDWFMDGRKHMLLSPAYHAASLVSFALTSPSIAHARAVSALAGIASVALLYVLSLRLTEDRIVAALTAFLFATTHFFVLMSRTALIEASELCCVLAALVVLTRNGYGRAALGGLLFGLAALCKINILFMAPVIGALLAVASSGPWRAAVLRFAIATAVAAVAAGAVYGALYLAHPTEFRDAFMFELDGKHFELISHPLIRVGRFGFDPIQAGRTIVALVVAEPVLIGLGLAGSVIAVRERHKTALWFAGWGAVGSAYILGQMYQPVRYFYLIAPALCFLAALAIVRFSTRPSGRTSPARLTWAVSLYAAFSLAYLAAGAGRHPGTMLNAVDAWARTVNPADNVMASAYLCTDLPNRAYGQYFLASTPAQMVNSIRRYDIKYVVFDRQEWSAAVGAYLEAHYPEVARWPFGAAFDVSSAGQRSAAVAATSAEDIEHHLAHD